MTKDIFLVSDEFYPFHEDITNWLLNREYTLKKFGSFITKQECSWTDVLGEASQALEQNPQSEGIFFCWSGTGASIIANKHEGLRAALCFDGETASLARVWNRANVLVLPNRILSATNVFDVLEKWFEPYTPQISEEDLKVFSIS